MEGQGSRLKKIRLEKGISLEDVSKRTKISIHILKAIEDDAAEGLKLSPIYVKGFIKIYCRFLDIEHSDFTKELPDAHEPRQNQQKEIKHQEKKAQSQELAAPRKPFKLKINTPKIDPALVKQVVFSLLVVAAAFLLVKGISKIHLPRRGAARPPVKKVVAEPVVRKTNPPAVTVKKKPVQSIQKVTESKPRAASQQALPAQPVQPLTAGVHLGVRSKEDVWLQIKIDGQPVFQGILKKGRFESWTGKERIDFSVGKAGAVDIEINGRLIPAIGRKGQSVKNAVITRDGLKLKE